MWYSLLCRRSFHLWSDVEYCDKSRIFVKEASDNMLNSTWICNPFFIETMDVSVFRIKAHGNILTVVIFWIFIGYPRYIEAIPLRYVQKNWASMLGQRLIGGIAHICTHLLLIEVCKFFSELTKVQSFPS